MNRRQLRNAIKEAYSFLIGIELSAVIFDPAVPSKYTVLSLAVLALVAAYWRLSLTTSPKQIKNNNRVVIRKQ